MTTPIQLLRDLHSDMHRTQRRYFWANLMCSLIAVLGIACAAFIKSEHDVLRMMNQFWTLHDEVQQLRRDMGAVNVGIRTFQPSGKFPVVQERNEISSR